MSDGRMALNFFEVGLVLTLVSMVLGPFEITEWAIAAALVACFVALGGMYLAFSSWNEPDDPAPGTAAEASREPGQPDDKTE